MANGVRAAPLWDNKLKRFVGELIHFWPSDGVWEIARVLWVFQALAVVQHGVLQNPLGRCKARNVHPISALTQC